jgi:Cu+-exporting ATPase
VVNFANRVSRWFTIAVISIASLSALYWLQSSLALALNAFTAVLIVACPCALALSTPFTLGNTLRIFGKNKFYLKRTSVIEALAGINTVVFDKTGTLTRSRVSKIEFVPSEKSGRNLTSQELNALASLSRQSSHPLSQQIFAHLNIDDYRFVENFQEFPGKGTQGRVNDFDLKMGSAQFIIPSANFHEDVRASHVHCSINGEYKGYYKIENNYRKGLAETISALISRYKLFMLTGDNDSERQTLLEYFKDDSVLKFKQSPFDKLDFIKNLKAGGEKVLMIGDGLNDAGALKQSDAGISISDDINTFSPSSDAILDGEQFNRLTDFLHFSRQSLRIILASFIISFVYNFVGLYFAVQGTLSPLIAAILMPASSITIIVFTTGATTLLAKKYGMWKMFRS